MLNSKSLLSPQSSSATASSLLHPCKIHLCFSSTASCSISSLFAVQFRSESPSIPSSSRKFQQPHLGFCSLYMQRRAGFPVCAQKKRGKVDIGLMEMDDSEDDYGEEEDGDFDEFNDDGEEGMIVSFGKMTKWLENKPRGFGEGKVYDTFIEDELLEEIGQSRAAQAANLNNLKNDPTSPNSNKKIPAKKAPEADMTGVRVRVLNLPKKKNIRRDLKSAFEGVPGIVDIVPVNAGNKKTREPVCKGFAFIDFKSDEHASRFVETFSGQNLTFGKIQKQIKCELMNTRSSSSAHEDSADNTKDTSQFIIPEVETEHVDNFDMDDFDMDDLEEFDDFHDEIIEIGVEGLRENLESVIKSNSNGVVTTTELRTKFTTESVSRNELEIMQSRERIKALEKRLLAKARGEKVPREKLPTKDKREKAPRKKLTASEKREKVPKLEIPGSAKRLKVKEKAVLTDVLSRYGAKAAPASKVTDWGSAS